MFSAKDCSYVSLSDLTLNLYRNILLSHFEIDIPETYSRDHIHSLLKILKIYKNRFGTSDPGDLLAIFKGDDFVNIKNTSGTLMFGKDYCIAPCAICNIAVTDGVGKLGQGLNCSGCGRWFHNNCNNEPLTPDAFTFLSESPDYVRVVCPGCYVSEKNLANSVESLSSEFKIMKNDFDGQFDVLKSCMSDLTNFVKSIPIDYPCSCAEMATKLDNFSKTESAVISNHVSNCENAQKSLSEKLKEIEVPSNILADLQLSVFTIQKDMCELSSNFHTSDSEDLVKKVISSTEDVVSELKESVETTNKSISELGHNLKTSTVSYEAALDTVVNQANRLDTIDFQAIASNIASVQHDSSNMLDQVVFQETVINSVTEKVVQGINSALSAQSTKNDEKLSSNTEYLNEIHTKINQLSQISGYNSDEICSGNCVTAMQTKLDSIISKAPAGEILPVESTSESGWSTVVSRKSPITIANGSVTQSAKSTAKNRPTAPSKQTKNDMDTKKTISIGNVNDSSISNSAKIKSQFNKCFPRMEIIHCKRAINGFILVEVDTPEIAKNVIQNWKGSEFFNNGTGGDTYVHLLEDVRAKAIIQDVDKDLTEEFMTKEIQNNYPNATTKRLRNKSGPTHVVLLTFSSKADMERAQNEKLAIGNTIYRTRPYEVRRKLIQCYQCYSFNHIARNCTKPRVCPFCSGSHKENECEMKINNETDKFTCTNCKGNHSALSKECNVYKKFASNMENHDG